MGEKNFKTIILIDNDLGSRLVKIGELDIEMSKKTKFKITCCPVARRRGSIGGELVVDRISDSPIGIP